MCNVFFGAKGKGGKGRRPRRWVGGLLLNENRAREGVFRRGGAGGGGGAGGMFIGWGGVG